MTILLKDMGTAVISGYTGTSANNAYTSTSVETIDSPSVGPTGQIYTVTPDGRLNLDRTTYPKGIYLATAQEYATVANSLYPVGMGQSLSWQLVQMENLGRSLGFGTPMYTFTGGYWMAMWNGDNGIGFYIFVGYDVSNPPSQTLYYNPATQTYSPTPINYTDQYADATWLAQQDADETTQTAVDALETEIFGSDEGFYVLGGGYNDPLYDPNSGLPEKIDEVTTATGIPYFVSPTVSVETTVTTTTTIPASEATTTTTVIPYSYIVSVTNQGWNSWARSIDPLAAGEYILFTIMSGVHAAQLAIGPKGKEGNGINTFSHALMIDSEGIHVYENGAKSSTMKLAQVATSLLRIYRHEDNTIHYVVTTGTETIVHRSALASPYPLVVPLYVYGHLYTSGDKVLSARFRSGEIHYGSV